MTTTTFTEISDGIAPSAKSEQSTSVVYATFNYYSRETPPNLDDMSIFIGKSPDVTHCDLPVTDLRSLPRPLAAYSHETHGFQILHQQVPINSSHACVHDPTVMNSEYYPSIVSLLKEKLNVRSAVVMNRTMRDVSTPEDYHVVQNSQRPAGKGQAPFFAVHADYSPAAARAHFRAMTPEWFKETKTEVGTTEEERAHFFALRNEIITAENSAMTVAGLEAGDGEVLTGKGGQWSWDGRGYDGPRYAMFSIWRPWETVKRDPLAVMDTQGFNAPYVALPRSYRKRPGCVSEFYNENGLIKPPTLQDRQRHKWCYISQQEPDEVYAIKLYDSEAVRHGGGSMCLMCPHSAFHTKEMDDQPARRSCELRVWCIW